MPAITETSSLEDVCFAACTALERAGTVAVLTGGSAATYYAPEAYQSGDADFIITFSSDLASAGATMRSPAPTAYAIVWPPFISSQIAARSRPR
jgi:hypothetical protein